MITRLRVVTLPMMSGLLSVYVVQHLRRVGSIALFSGTEPADDLTGESLLILGRSLDVISALFLICTALMAAWVVSSQFDGTCYERPLVFGLSAFGFIVIPLAAVGGIASWCGTALLRPPGGPLLSAIPGFALVMFAIMSGWRPAWPRLVIGSPSGLILSVGVMAATLILYSIVTSLTHPPNGYDALGYHAPLSVFLWQDGNLTSFLDRQEGNWTLAHPGIVHLWLGLLGLIGGERLANLGQLPFAFLGSVAARAFASRLGLPRSLSMLAGCAYLLMPMVVMQLGMQLADLAGSALLMSTLSLACAPTYLWTPRRLSLLGFGLGLSMTAKLALLPPTMALGCFVLGTLIWKHLLKDGDFRLIRIGLPIVCLLPVIAPWWLRNTVKYQNPLYPASLPFVGRGGFVPGEFGKKDSQFVPRRLAWAVYPFVERHSYLSGVGSLFVMAIPGFLLAVFKARRRAIFVYLLVTMRSLTSWWLLTAHEPRFLLALMGLFFGFLPWSLLALPRKQLWLGSLLLVIAAGFSVFLTFQQALLPFARQPKSRLNFYDSVWGVDPVVLLLPESEGLLLITGYAHNTYPGFYPLLGQTLKRDVIQMDRPELIDAVVTKMREVRLRYVNVTAAPESQPDVEKMYGRFRLVHTSLVESGLLAGTRRYLYRLRSESF